MNFDAGSCAGASVQSERMTHMSSMCSPSLGNSSETSTPLLPFFSNLKGDGKARPLRPGSAWSAYLASDGLGSHVSTCDGPPGAQMWITCFALALKCGCLAASGDFTVEPATAAP